MLNLNRGLGRYYLRCCTNLPIGTEAQMSIDELSANTAQENAASLVEEPAAEELLVEELLVEEVSIDGMCGVY
jgi:mycofactocin precursor